MSSPDRPLIPLAKPWLGEAELEAVAGPLRSGWVTQGPQVKAFEQEFAAFVGSPHACAVSSCTAALHMALRALGIGKGDEVITASHSFIATANAVRYVGAVPVFVDIDPATFNLDPARLPDAVSERTRAVLAVHQMGMPCDIGAVVEFARESGLYVIEDAACATGSKILRDQEWRPIGRPDGHVACFSFHPRKLLTTGDGGMLTTADPELDAKFRLLRQHAMSVPDSVRHSAREVVFEEYLELGYNYRMTDIQGAIGRAQLRKLPEMVENRRRQVARYRELLADVPGLALPHEPSWCRSNWQSLCVRLPDGCDQRAVMQAMLNHGVATRRGIMCSHREPAFAHEPWRAAAIGASSGGDGGAAAGALEQSEQAQDQTVVLPLFHEMSEEELVIVSRTLIESLAAMR